MCHLQTPVCPVNHVTFLFLSLFLLLLLHSFRLLVVGSIPTASSLTLCLVLRIRKVLLAGYPLIMGPDYKHHRKDTVCYLPFKGTTSHLVHGNVLKVSPTRNAFVGIFLLLVSAVWVGSVLRYRLHLDARGVRQHTEVLKQALLDLLQVLSRVLVGHVGRADVQLEVGPKVLKVIIVGQLVGDGAVQGHSCLIGPATGHVTNGVASATQHQQRQVETFDVLNAFGMTWSEYTW